MSGDVNNAVHPELCVTRLNTEHPTPFRAILYQLHISKYKILKLDNKQQKYQQPSATWNNLSIFGLSYMRGFPCARKFSHGG
jgi:hypothetical protein